MAQNGRSGAFKLLPVWAYEVHEDSVGARPQSDEDANAQNGRALCGSAMSHPNLRQGFLDGKSEDLCETLSSGEVPSKCKIVKS